MPQPKPLLAHPMTRCYTLINGGKFNNRTPNNTIPSWLLPCTCLLPKHKYPRPSYDLIYYVSQKHHRQLNHHSPPNPNIKVQIAFTYCKGTFPTTAIEYKLDKYAILQPLLIQHGMSYRQQSLLYVLGKLSILKPPNSLKEFNITTCDIQKLMKSFSQFAIRYLMHIILNKWKLEKKLSLIPLDKQPNQNPNITNSHNKHTNTTQPCLKI